MSMIEKWNSIVSDVEENRGLKEEAVQKLWEDIFADANVFGYSKRSKEIDIWRSLQVGSRERAVPDIIIRDSIKNKDLFVVELKQHNRVFEVKFKEQLLSYMKLLELKVGLLICDKLYLLYRENNSVEYTIEIPFELNDNQGAKFIELFCKGEFEENKVKKYILERNEMKNLIIKVRQDVQQLDVKDLIKKHFNNKYKTEFAVEECVDEALKNFDIKVVLVPEKFVKLPKEKEEIQSNETGEEDDISKFDAIKIFENKGYVLKNKTTTFASKNKGNDNYWANPNVDLLQENWHIILKDWRNKKLYLFYIPRNAIRLSQLVIRNDRPKIDLQILYSDYLFTDSRSGMKFRQFLIDEVNY